MKKLNENSLIIPGGKSLHCSDETKLLYIIVCDEAFPLTKQLLRPYARKNFNY